MAAMLSNTVDSSSDLVVASTQSEPDDGPCYEVVLQSHVNDIVGTIGTQRNTSPLTDAFDILPAGTCEDKFGSNAPGSNFPSRMRSISAIGYNTVDSYSHAQATDGTIETQRSTSPYALDSARAGTREDERSSNGINCVIVETPNRLINSRRKSDETGSRSTFNEVIDLPLVQAPASRTQPTSIAWKSSNHQLVPPGSGPCNEVDDLHSHVHETIGTIGTQRNNLSDDALDFLPAEKEERYATPPDSNLASRIRSISPDDFCANPERCFNHCGICQRPRPFKTNETLQSLHQVFPNNMVNAPHIYYGEPGFFVCGPVDLQPSEDDGNICFIDESAPFLNRLSHRHRKSKENHRNSFDEAENHDVPQSSASQSVTNGWKSRGRKLVPSAINNWGRNEDVFDGASQSGSSETTYYSLANQNWISQIQRPISYDGYEVEQDQPFPSSWKSGNEFICRANIAGFSCKDAMLTVTKDSIDVSAIRKRKYDDGEASISFNRKFKTFRSIDSGDCRLEMDGEEMIITATLKPN